MTELPHNQTNFTEQAPLHQDPLPVITSQKSEAQAITSPVKGKSLLLILGGGVVFLFIILIGVALLFQSNLPSVPTTTSSPVPSATTTSMHPLQGDLDLLEKDIQSADPDTTDIPFPPVNLKLRLLDPKTRND